MIHDQTDLGQQPAEQGKHRMLLGAGKIVFEIAAAGIDERACALFTSRHGSLRALTQSLRQSRVRLTLPLPMGPYKPEETIGVGGQVLAP
ncbi:MAG TPA: hypothetical protein VFO87_12875 [Nitrospira sp.]|nr:hypothetical protein [Nitrospira sp.]